MVSRCHTVAFQGVEIVPVEVQVQVSAGLPAFTVVGLPDKAVAESRERVRAAIQAMGLSLPAKRITINLAPADLIKEGSHFDLPIALALLAAMGVVPSDALGSYFVLGELALDGRLQAVNGVLPAAMGASARECGLICPAANGAEAAWAGDIGILAAPHLLALINHFKGTQVLSAPQAQSVPPVTARVDLSEVRGQETAKRVLEIAAAGGHNLLMCGPPGAGKSMLAACLPGILPPMTAEEMLQSSMIQSIAGNLKQGRLQQHRPFRDPHHSSSMAAMVGGGRRALPGEISLSHHGVLFLDELPEFPRGVLEALRQPLEEGRISVARAQAHVTYPAEFQLIAAMNPCRCGYLGDAARACNKAPRCGADYQNKLSGPLLDRIDLHLDVPAVPPLDVFEAQKAQTSAEVATRVLAARKRQMVRGKRVNARVSGDVLFEQVTQNTACKALLEEANQKFHLTMRGLTRVLRVARTIADLAASEAVEASHLSEALAYRQR
ncbi:MAG: YifB family Mg chelatase-like AAA ATPase [Rickettsiales bacterium]|nr:YifB family Mg chelatase-like AAA ATPase [Rickettsiales bacterium]